MRIVIEADIGEVEALLSVLKKQPEIDIKKVIDNITQIFSTFDSHYQGQAPEKK